MDGSLFIIFGLPGAGKSYVADVFCDRFGYTIYNGDDDIPESMKDALYKKTTITDDMRREFLEAMIVSIGKLTKKHTKLAVHQTFLKEFMRLRFGEVYPHATFLLVKSSKAIREERYMKRQYFNLGLPYLRHMSKLFDPPVIRHKMIRNDKPGTEKIICQIRAFIEPPSVP